MSSTPKYSPVSISAERQRELDARRDAERRRLAEAERRRREEIQLRIEAERRERRERMELRRAEVEQQREERAAEAHRRLEAGRVEREERREQTRRTRDAAKGHREAPPSHRVRADPPDRSSADELDMAAPDTRGDALPAMPDARTDAALEQLAQLGATSLAQAAVLRAEGARHAELASPTVVARATEAVERALAEDDEHAITAALAWLDGELASAWRAHAAALERAARRRTIAQGVIRALPDRYVVPDDALALGPDGSLHFSAFALDQELRMSIVGDGAGGEVIACAAEGHAFEVHNDNGVEIAACPGLAAELEETNERLLRDGFVPGTWTWPGAASPPGAAELQGRRVRPGSRAQRRRAEP
jgi:hypothetical protein